MIDSALLSEKNLWTHLEATPFPIVLYGMGNGADKILEVMEKRHIPVADFFASDGFVRHKLFHGKPILSLSQIEEKYEKFIILVAFGSSLDDVMARIISLSHTHELYAPDVPVCGGERFDADFYLAHKQEFDCARSLLADEKSKEVFDDILSYKLSGNISYLLRADTPKHDALTGLLSGGYTAYADLGAYKGDTVEEALAYFPTVGKIAAFEPSPKIHAKLAAYLETLDGIRWETFPLCAWNCHEIRTLTDGAGRNTTLGGVDAALTKTQNGARIHTCECDTLDARTDFVDETLLIKYDVEGAEAEALTGSAETIRRNHTELIVSLYHKSRDLFSLPLLVHKLLPAHRLYLRKHPYIPAWDVNLYVCKP